MPTTKRFSISRSQKRRYRLFVCLIVFSIISAIYFGIRPGRASSDKDANAPSFANPSSTIFINEFHYDDSTAPSDVNEFVEVAGPAGTNLTGWSIVLYNGSGGASYDTDPLPASIPAQQGGYGTVSIGYPTNGIQNGSPDGIALVNNGVLVQFLCYEGPFTATNGPANGVLCTDVGVSETNATAPGSSLHLQGTGTTYGNFAWAVTTTNTMGSPNTGQTFTGGPPVDIPPTVQSTNPADNATNVAVNANVGVTFSEAVTATASSFQISCATSGAHTFALGGGPTTYSLDPGTDFTLGEVCTVTVFAAQVTDQDGTPDNMAADFVFDFTVVGGPPTPIHTIQGSGTASPLDGQVVTTTGIVTLVKTTTNTGGAANGFFIQTPDADADADPNTSQGILVFTSSVPTVAVGDEVTVTGTVDEFFDMTEISPVTDVSLIDTGNPLPTPVTLTTTILDPAALPTQPQLEKFEGMRMTAPSLTAATANDPFFDVYTVITGVPRPMREPGIELSLPMPPDPTTGLPDCCVPRWDENPERILLDTNARAGAPLTAYTSNVVFTSVTGPLDFSFDEYRLIPDAALSATANMSAVPVPTPTATEFTVAGFNIENFANNATQRQKAALGIRDVMRLPHIIGVAEIFELTGLQALATEVNTIAPGRTYQAHLVEADGTSGDSDQDVGYLVDTSRVLVNSVVQRNAAETYINPNTGLPELLNDRPPLVLDANVDPTGANVRVIVIVNHLRSFIDVELVAGEGVRVRAKRKAQAESLAALLQEYQTNNPTTSVISVGDYNAYQFSDGYTDPIATIKGNPTPDDQIVVDASPDVVDPNFINLVDGLSPSERYSFVFEGTPQALDHVLINTVAHFLNTRFAIARQNADFPEVPAATFVSNNTRPERNSDHDAPVAYFSLTGPTAAPASVSGAVTTASGQPLAGVTMHLSGAEAATTITDSHGNYHFDNVDTEQFYTVTPERVNYNFNPSSHSFSLLANKTDAAFTAIPEAVIVGNAIDSTEYFVRQHYLDFLGREPDPAGFRFWNDQVLGCGADAGCVERKRINVSAAYFLSIEFQRTGGWVDGLYRASYGRRPLYAEFVPDSRFVAEGVVVANGGDWAQRLVANQRAFVDAFVNRAAFRAVYDGMTNDGYVDRLISHTGVSFSSEERDALVSGLNSGSSTRAGVLLRIAEHDGFVSAKRNEMFVMMEYFGYLRRDPDAAGLQFWLNKLNEFEGNFERAEMVKAFINSGEYRARFPR